MPPPSTSPWKHVVFAALAGAERAVLGKQNFGPTELREIRNFLVLQYESALGSVVHAAPLFEALKSALPDGHITVAASPMAASVLGNNSFIDRCLVTPNPFLHWKRAVAVVRDLLRELSEGPRCIITTIGNQRTRLAMLALMAGKSARVGYTLAPELYDVALPFIPEHGQIEGNLDIVRSLGHNAVVCEPKMFFEPDDARYAEECLEEAAGNSTAPRIAFITRNSGGQRNQWKPERFPQVVGSLRAQESAVPVFLGTAADCDAIEEMRRQLANSGISLAGKTTIPQLAAVLAQCDLIVSLDTGAFHIARAVGLPGVVIAPAWQDPREWLPIGNSRYRILRGPSIAVAPPDYCMEEISAEQVVGAATELLREFPPSSSSRASRSGHSTIRPLDTPV